MVSDKTFGVIASGAVANPPKVVPTCLTPTVVPVVGVFAQTNLAVAVPLFAIVQRSD